MSLCLLILSGVSGGGCRSSGLLVWQDRSGLGKGPQPLQLSPYDGGFDDSKSATFCPSSEGLHPARVGLRNINEWLSGMLLTFLSL